MHGEISQSSIDVAQSREEVSDRTESERVLRTRLFGAGPLIEDNHSDITGQPSQALSSAFLDNTGWNRHKCLWPEKQVLEEENTGQRFCLNTMGTAPNLYIKKEVLAEKFGVKFCELCQSSEQDNKQQTVYTISIKNSAFLFSLHCCTCLVNGKEVFVLDLRAGSAQRFMSSFLRLLVNTNEANIKTCLNLFSEACKMEKPTKFCQAESFQDMGLTVLEVVLMVAFFQLNSDLKALQEADSKVSSSLRDHVTSSTFGTLETMKKSCLESKSKAEALETLLSDIKNDEEELRKLSVKIGLQEKHDCLDEEGSDFGLSDFAKNEVLTVTTKTDREVNKLEEVHDVLRHFIQRAGGVALEAERFFDRAQIFEDSSKVLRSMQHYEISRSKVRLSIAVLAASIAALFTAILGINFRSQMDLNHLVGIVFLVSTLGIVILSHASYSRQRT